MASIPPNTNSLTRLVGGSTSDIPDTPTTTILRNVGSEYLDNDQSVVNIRESVGRLPTATVIDDDPQVAYSADTTKPTTETKFQGQDPDNLFSALTDYSHSRWNHNRLGDYQNTTYKIRFFMIDDSPVDFDQFQDYAAFVHHVNYDRKQTTIVESGVTGMNISSLDMETRAAPGLLMRTMISTTMTLNVHEPMGVNLLDTMASAAKEMGVKNYSKAGYLLEIKFQGYTEDGLFETNIYKDSPNKGVWLYYVQVTDVQSEINSTGANYKLSLRLFEEIFHQRDLLQIPDATSPTGDTIGVMLDDFADKLNNSIYTMYGYQLIKYKFQIRSFIHDNRHYDPKTFKVAASKIHFQDRRANSPDVAHGSIKGAFQRGTMIHDAVEQIFAASEDMQKLAKDVSVTEVINAEGEKRMRSSVVPRIRPVIKYTGYDFATEQYEQEITIVVMPYSSQVPVLTREQVEISKDTDVQKRNMEMLFKAGYLAKRYDYIFTGLNTEVINFDIKLNMNWTNILPKVMGLNNSMATQAAHDIYNDEKRTFNDRKSAIANNQSRLKEIQDATRLREEAQQILDGLPLSTEKEEVKQKLREDAEKNLAAYTPRELAEDREAAIRAVQADRAAVQSEGNTRIPPVNPGRETVKYAEEIAYEQRLTESSKPIPVSTTESNEDTRFFFAGGMPEAYHRDRAIMGAVMDQIYNVKGESDLQTINLEVRGDPYWLGGGNVMRTLLTLKDTTINLQEKDASDDTMGPNIDKGAIMFLLTFKYPNGVADDGSPILKPHEFFTGIYQVQDVTHSFSGGLYQQTLRGNRHKLQDVFKAFGVPQIDESTPPATNPTATFSDVKRS